MNPGADLSASSTGDCKVTVQSLIAADQFIAETEARHQTMLFEPEDGTKRSREEYAFDGSERNHAFSKTGSSRVAPSERPLRFPLDAWYSLNRLEEVHLLDGVFNASVDEEAVCLAVDVFDSDLKAIEALGFR